MGMHLAGWIWVRGATLMAERVDARETIHLPKPRFQGQLSLEQVIARRRSVRDFTTEPLSIEQLGQLCWAAQGVTDTVWGLRAAPSAGALYPLEIYVVTATGVYHYNPHRHELKRTIADDLRHSLQSAALGQECIGDAPAVFVIAAVFERTAIKYGRRAERYVYLEAGHACQNLLLEAVSLGLGGVPVGAFEDEGVAALLKLGSDLPPIYLVPVGRPAR